MVKTLKRSSSVRTSARTTRKSSITPNNKSGKSNKTGIKELIPHKLYTTQISQSELAKLIGCLDKYYPANPAASKKDTLKYYELTRKLNKEDKKILIDTAAKLLNNSGLWVKNAGLIEVFKYDMKGGKQTSIFGKHSDNDTFETFDALTVNSCVIYLRRDTDIQNCNMNYYTIDPTQTKFRKIFNPKLITHTIPAETGTAILMKGNLLHQQEVCKGNGICDVLVIRLYEP
jgi:hypothetical protein